MAPHLTKRQSLQTDQHGERRMVGAKAKALRLRGRHSWPF
jgi:hypothetical protein